MSSGFKLFQDVLLRMLINLSNALGHRPAVANARNTNTLHAHPCSKQLQIVPSINPTHLVAMEPAKEVSWECLCTCIHVGYNVRSPSLDSFVYLPEDAYANFQLPLHASVYMYVCTYVWEPI